MLATRFPLLDDATFDEAVRPDAGAVAVQFTAEWCGACRVMEPALSAVAEALDGQVRFHAVDADANPRTVTRFAVRALPTVLLFRDGKLVERVVGAQSRAALSRLLSE